MSKPMNPWDTSNRKRFKAAHSHGHQSKGWQRKCYSYAKMTERGYDSEGIVRSLLFELKAKGLITRFKQSAEFSKEDKEGSDFIVWYRGHPVPLQVKSSHRGMLQHRGRTRTYKPVVNAHSERLEHYLLKSLRWYVARLLPVLEIGDPMQQPYKLSTMACYYMLEVFRANISHEPFDAGVHQDVAIALQPLLDIGFLACPSEKKYNLTQGGFECVKWILERRKEPKRYFMNQCKRFGPKNWKESTETLFGYKAIAEEESPLVIPEGTCEELFWEKSAF